MGLAKFYNARYDKVREDIRLMVLITDKATFSASDFCFHNNSIRGIQMLINERNVL